MKKFIKLFLLVFPLLSISQSDDILWASYHLQTPLTESITLNIKPTIRLNDALSSYENSSIDVFAKKKLDKGWSVQLFSRTWFNPDEKGRQFVWTDVAHGFALSKINIVNRLRFHWALDINDRMDPDFLRWHTKFSLKTNGSISPYIGIEPWYRLNSINEFRRIRFEPGLRWNISETYALDVQYRIQNEISQPDNLTVNQYVATLIYKLPAKSSK